MSKVDEAFKDFVRGRISKASYERRLEELEQEENIGRRVRITKQFDMHGRPGLEGKIIAISQKGNYAIHFDKHMHGHTCSGKVPSGYGYNVSPHNLEFID